MPSFTQRLYDSISSFVKFLFSHIVLLSKKIWDAKDNISLKDLWNDFLSILSSVGMIAFFNFLALIIFIFLPQGKMFY